MNKIRLDDRSLGYINLFSALTNARVRDFINFDDRFVFIVEKGDIGIALGRHGEKIKKIKETIKKNIEVIEHSENAEEFIRSIFHNYKIENVRIIEKDNKKTAFVSIELKNKGRAIGKQGKNLKEAREILLRHHNIENMIIE